MLMLQYFGKNIFSVYETSSTRRNIFIPLFLSVTIFSLGLLSINNEYLLNHIKVILLPDTVSLDILIAIILQLTLYTSFVPWTDGFSLICYQSVNRLQVFLLNSLIGLIICMLVLIVILKFAPSLLCCFTLPHRFHLFMDYIA